MPTNVLYTDTHIAGNFSAQSMTLPASSVSNSNVAAGATIDADKLENRHVIKYYQKNGTAITAETVPIYICRPANGATIVEVELVITGAVGTSDRVVNVDVHKTAQGDTPATILSGATTFTSSTVLYEVEQAGVADPDLAQGDILLLVITVSGSGGTQAQGLCITVTIDEQPT